MKFAGQIWKLLLGVKDVLVLTFMMLFFVLLFGILSARPSPGMVREGALLLELDGYIVEERSSIEPLQAILSQEIPIAEYEVSGLIEAIDSAATDPRIKAIALDLSRFLGGGQVHLQEVGEALQRVRRTNKPVIAFAMGYSDDALHLAAHASEVWIDPLGAAIVMGPGGSYLMYGDLLKQLDVNVRVYRVGTFKGATEPYTNNSLSKEVKDNIGSLQASLWSEWKANVAEARPNAEVGRVTSDTIGWIQEAEGDLANAALQANLVDVVGTRTDWGERLAGVVGEDSWTNEPGSFAATTLRPYLADIRKPNSGKAIGVITVAGTLVDGTAGPGTAGGDRIARLLDQALGEDLAGLVVRLDTPGGSLFASEQIRRAIERFKQKDIPIAISMANISASGGYYIATIGDRIFAQPETITGSIGVFSVIPTFENTARRIGINAEGIRTTPLSGQPDIIAGLTTEVDTILQASVEDAYRDFLNLISNSRGLSVSEVDQIGQGRVWDGGTARQLNLIDQFGNLQDAADWVASEAGLTGEDWHLMRLGAAEGGYETLLRQILSENDQTASSSQDIFATLTRQQTNTTLSLIEDLERLTSLDGIQAYCVECPRETKLSGSSNFETIFLGLKKFLTPNQ